MKLALQNQQTLLSNMAAAVQGACNKLLNFKTGSVLRAILEAFAATGLWFQYLIVQVWLGARLSTSSGVDVDSFINDFSLLRLPPAAAYGLATFSRFSAGVSAVIAPYFLADGTTNTTTGAQVLSADGLQSFGIKQDITNPRWNAPLNAYFLPVGVTSIDVLVQAITTGAGGNVQAGGISQLASAIPGVDTVANAQPFTTGFDAESDVAVKARFTNYVNTRARATPAAVEFAVTSFQAGLTYSLSENKDSSGNYMPGNFVLTIDDGTGAPSASLLAAVYQAVDAVRPVGSSFSVLGPQLQVVTVSMTITVGPAGNKGLLISAVQTAILDYIDTLPIGAMLPWSKLAQVAYGASPNITNVSQIFLNGATFDVVPAINGVIKAGVVAIN